ncbi:MAG: sensor histidine kinase [Bacillota bacterium]|nr:sensor histidine kinase [Bacillota bacterium]
MPKKSLILRICIVVALTMVGSIIIYNEDPVNVTYAMTGFFLVMILGFKGSLWPRISAVLVLYPIITAYNFIYPDIGYRIYLCIGMWGNGMQLIFRVVSAGIFALMWYFIYRLARKRLSGVIQYLDGRSWLFVDIICLSPFISVIVSVITTPTGREWGIYLISLASVVTSITVFFLLSSLASRVRSEAEIANLRLRNSYYRELEAKQEEIRRLRHDMRNNLGVIGGLLEGGERDEALAYLKEITAITASTTCSFCENSVVNAVLNAKYREASEKGISCDIAVDIDNVLSMDSVDICTIIGNTMDNAIEAASFTKEPFIVLKARCHNGYFSFQINNSKSNEAKISQGRFISTKEDGKNHGLGLAAVEAIVEKYAGNIDISYNENEFTVLIIIKL